jgi:CheY-like chemotaxis protein
MNNFGVGKNLNVSNNTNEALEIVVIEENKLSNMLLSQTFESTIKRIRNLKNFPIKFSSFHSRTKFLTYLEDHDFGASKMIVFTDYRLENEETGQEILKQIQRKEIDATMIVMSDSGIKEKVNQDYYKKWSAYVPEKDKKQVIYS